MGADFWSRYLGFVSRNVAVLDDGWQIFLFSIQGFDHKAGCSSSLRDDSIAMACGELIRIGWAGEYKGIKDFWTCKTGVRLIVKYDVSEDRSLWACLVIDLAQNDLRTRPGEGAA